jgi:hypothetical protein
MKGVTMEKAGLDPNSSGISPHVSNSEGCYGLFTLMKYDIQEAWNPAKNNLSGWHPYCRSGEDA